MRLTALALLVSSAVLLVGCDGERQASPSEGQATAEEGRAPDFTLPTLEQTAFTLSDHRGQVVLLNFWATWCGPCVIEVPHLVRLQDEFEGRGLMIAGVSQDSGPDAFDEVREFADRFDVNYPLLLDPDFEVSQSYGVHSLPTTIVVDQHGAVRHERIGLLSYDDLRGMVEDVLTPDESGEGLEAITLHGLSAPGLLSGRSRPAVEEISAEDAGVFYGEGAMVVDLRDAAERDVAGAIPFALEMPFERLDPSVLPANIGVPILFVATDESISLRAANRAVSWGYTNVYAVNGGFEAWLGAGLPTGRESGYSEWHAL